MVALLPLYIVDCGQMVGGTDVLGGWMRVIEN
jgi:hypothetical protein